MTPLNWLRWLRDREPVWMVGGAAAVLDAVSYLVPAVPSSWHPAVDVVLAVLTLLAQRRLVWSPATVAKLLARAPATGGLIKPGSLLLDNEIGPPPLVVPRTSGGGHVTVQKPATEIDPDAIARDVSDALKREQRRRGH